MKYEVNVSEVKNPKGNLRGFASVVFDDSFKVSNITIMENKEGKMYISMPYYSNSNDEENKDICHPITKEFRQELEDSIIQSFEDFRQTGERKHLIGDGEQEMSFKVSVTPFEREGRNICGLARIYFDDCFLINNVSLLQGKNGVFISMPSYKTKQIDGNGRNVYKDVCFPITKEFREKLNSVIMQGFEQAKKNQQEVAKEQSDNFVPISDAPDNLPFR